MTDAELIASLRRQIREERETANFHQNEVVRQLADSEHAREALRRRVAELTEQLHKLEFAFNP